MILKEIKLKTFKCFEDYSVSFDNINLIEGSIGIGKSTILEALIFALYGFSTASLLSDLPTRGKAESCKVTAVIEDNGHVIEVIREFPLKLTVKDAGKTIKMSTAEGNTYLIDRFGSKQDFFQFRIVDAYSKETNLLEQGNVVFKKILFAGADEKFNEIRNNLNVIKLERERLNRDGIVLDICYPSEKRLEVLNASLNDVINRYREMDGDISLADKGLRDSEIKLTSNEGAIKSLNNQISNIDALRSSFDNKMNDTESSISLYNTKIENCENQIKNINTIRSSYDTELYQKESRHSEVPKILEDINKQIKNIDNLRSSFEDKLQDSESYILNREQEILNCKHLIENLNKETDTVIKTKICYTCKRPLEEHTTKDILKEQTEKEGEIRKKINTFKNEITIIKNEILKIKESIAKEKLQKLEEYYKKIEELNQEDIKNCARIPILIESIAKEKEETKKNLLNTIENYKIDISKATEEIEGLKQAIVTEKIQMLSKFKKEIEILQTENVDLTEDIKNTKEIITQDKDIRDNLLPKKEKIQSLKVRLENRLKQRQFIYTEKDVLIVKKALEHLDLLSSIYLIETIESLKPVLDSVLSKINCQCTFDIDDKGKFEIVLMREDIQYKYKDFSTGQRLLLQTALKLALLMQQGRSGLISSDEGLGSLDDETLEYVLNLFKELPFQLIFTRHGYENTDNEINVIKLGENNEKMPQM